MSFLIIKIFDQIKYNSGFHIFSYQSVDKLSQEWLKRLKTRRRVILY